MARTTTTRLGALVSAAALTLTLIAAGPAQAASAARSGAHRHATGTFPVTVATAYGPVTLTHEPHRIVSLSPTVTEMLFALGAGHQVVAVDADSNYPKSAPRTSLSGYTPNVEAIAGYRPDLVVISYNPTPPNLVASLKLLGIPTLYIPAAATLQQSYAETIELGRLTGHLAGARQVVASMTARIRSLVAQVPKRATRPTYFYELDPTLYTASAQTFIGSVLALAGLRDIVGHPIAGSDYPQLSSESVVRANPTFIFLADGAAPRSVAARPGWSRLAAVRAHRVIALNVDIASRWGPRTADLLGAVVRALRAGTSGHRAA